MKIESIKSVLAHGGRLWVWRNGEAVRRKVYDIRDGKVLLCNGAWVPADRFAYTEDVCIRENRPRRENKHPQTTEEDETDE